MDPPNWTILSSWDFETLILAYEQLVKALRSLDTCVSVDNNCELDNFIFKRLYWVMLYWYYIKLK